MFFFLKRKILPLGIKMSSEFRLAWLRHEKKTTSMKVEKLAK